MFRARTWGKWIVLSATILLAGCAQQMANQPKVKPLTASDFFADGQSSRPLPPNTIARSDVVNDELLNTGQINGQDADLFPFPITRDILLPAFDRAQRIAVVVGIIGLVVCLVGLFVNSALVMQSYLFAYLYWVGISLGCLGLLMIQFTVKGTWGLAIRRLSEAGALTIPLMAALFIPILLGAGVLYTWARPDVVSNYAPLQQESVDLHIPCCNV